MKSRNQLPIQLLRRLRAEINLRALLTSVPFKDFRRCRQRMGGGVCALIGMLMLSSCADPFDGQMFVTPTTIESEMTCTTLLENRPEDFSLWVDLLKYADYYNGLKDAKAVATVFAPTNDAIMRFLKWRGVTAIEELDRDYARQVVQNHIINGTSSGLKIDSESFINAANEGQSLNLLNLFQTYLRPTYGRVELDVDDAERTNEVLEPGTIFINNQAAVQPKDGGGIHFIEASNAIIYYLDDVIHPLSETMVDKLEQQGEYTIFASACRDCGYDKLVERVRDTIHVVGGGIQYNTYRFTCFAPNDEAMQRAGIHSLDDLKNRLREEDAAHADSALWRYVAYHFLNQSYTKDAFCSFDTQDETLIYDTRLHGEVITCLNDSETNYSVPLVNGKAHLVRTNIEARNGYIHKIDYWMPVWAPEPVAVRWDFCNQADIIAFVNAYGADKSLGELYSNAMTNREYQIDLSTNYRDGQYGELTSFTYQANAAKASYSNYRAVGYKKCKYVSTKEKDSNAYDAYLNNLLVLNLGYAGWIQFKTPTIIKGRYKVTLHYASEATMKAFHAAGSLTKFQIDPEDEEKGWSKNVYVFKGLPTASFSYGSGDVDLFNDVEFDISGIHTLRATMLDINAKTNGSYHQLWDYILFTPI
ncbi:MAG: DUF5108 domain-containing protein [Bacteroidaceae bacterium]|nr:DUF5108 domain-containing protein [Bacteroidaceae bacterium]